MDQNTNYTSTNTASWPTRTSNWCFRDVQAARADRERSKNEAEAYANDVIPRARGEAEQVLQQAEAYKEVVAKAEGEASRFLAIYNEYKMLNKLLKKECI